MNNFNHTVHESVVDWINNKTNLGKRYRSCEFQNLFLILKSKKYEKRLVKFEEFIDDCYSNENFNFKIDVQTDKKMRNLFQKFIDYENLLVRVLKNLILHLLINNNSYIYLF